jgi:hypothetical protein
MDPYGTAIQISKPLSGNNPAHLKASSHSAPQSSTKTYQVADSHLEQCMNFSTTILKTVLVFQALSPHYSHEI